MGGGSGQGPIDMSDFPTLSGAPRPQLSSTPSGSLGSTWNNTAIRQPSNPQPSSQAQILQARTPSAAPSLEQQQQQPAPGYLHGATADAPEQSAQAQQENGGATGEAAAVAATPQSGKSWESLSEKDRWGMAGLEAVFRHRRDRENGLAGDGALPQSQKTQAMLMGHDLSSQALGLDLESLEPLYPTFSVFGDLYDGTESSLAHRRPIPDFPLSESYRVSNVPSLLPRMSAMSDGESYTCISYSRVLPHSIPLGRTSLKLH
jgi:CCR4-NOT transcription complex subunit 2